MSINFNEHVLGVGPNGELPPHVFGQLELPDANERAAMQAVLDDYQAGQDATDTALASVITAGGQTKAALDNNYSRHKIVDANQHGVVADGTTNDHPAWQALVNSLEGTGATITWTGRSIVEAPILWKRGVNLVGQGWGRSVLATRGDAAELPFGAIEGFSPYATTANPYEDLLFKDFEVDGSELAYPGPSISGKAIFIQFMRRCQFVNLYLHDTIGTALGIDFLPDCLIHGVIVVNGGRGWTGNEGGHAGIGIGMGAWEEENTTISDCHTINCGHWGIFVERQNEQPYRARGAKIVNCSATGTRGTGIADVGNTDTLIMGCTSTNNGSQADARWRDGFQAMFGSVGTRFINNTASHNVGDGFNIRADNGAGITLAGNKATKNNSRGIVVSAEGQTLRGYTIRDNECAENRYDGIVANSGAAGSLPNLVVTGNRCYDNGKAGQVGADRGINIGANVTGGIINSNRCYDSQTPKTQQYGIALPSGTFIDTSLVGNNVVGNGTSGMVTTGATLTSLNRRANVGYLTENRGSGSIPAGAKTVTIIHGMSAPPTSLQVTPRTGGDPIWVATIGGSGFIVERAVALSGAGVDFTWTAEL